ncbi:hypothetical protein KQX54_007301 [Cotesia glomerata]|uniref:EB domain-containing protein n=1 Tax=Cotesia glomerata TaxID=32391 RepID=A0AAV7IGE7_COTGL|nr:hypothetical protein KQX54_007301 [Cotesia glomerata]
MSSIMILLFVIFGLSHANVLHGIDRCITHLDFCDVTFDNQCCSGYECRPIINETKSLTICLKKAYLGEECIDNQDCLEPDYAYCSRNKTCQCKNGYTRSYEILCSSLYLGAHCSIDIHCKVDNSACINFECKCAEGFQPLSNNQCISNPLGKACRLNKDCENLVFHSRCSKEYLCTYESCKGMY